MALTPYMSLLLPVVSSTVGPLYATEMNAAISNNGGDIDSHDHSPGKGKLVNVAGIGINANLPFAGFSATQLASTTFINQTVPATLNTLSLDANGNLFVNDNAGNSIQMTQAGAALGGSAANGITGAGYGSGGVTIAWVSGSKAYQLLQAATTFALLQTGPIHIFDTASGLSNSVNLLSPVSLSSSYSLTFPAALPAATGLVTVSSTGQLAFGNSLVSTAGTQFVLVSTSGVPSIGPTIPAAQAMVTIDASGNVTTIVPDNATLQIASGTTLQVKNAGITQAKLAALPTAGPTASSGSFTTTSTSFSTVTNQTTGSLTCTGRWVTINVQPDGTGNTAQVTASAAAGVLQLLRDGSTVIGLLFINTGSTLGSFTFIDVGAAAGTHTYTLQAKAGSTGTTLVENIRMLAYEL